MDRSLGPSRVRTYKNCSCDRSFVATLTALKHYRLTLRAVTEVAAGSWHRVVLRGGCNLPPPSYR